MSSFNSYRIPKSRKAAEAFEKWCSVNGYEFAKSGYEELISSSPEFKERIQKLDTKTAKRIRFFPDYQLVSELDAHLIEVKASKSMEKSAYDIYMDLQSIGYNVAVMIYDEDFDILKAVRINKLCFQHIRHADCPIIDNIWMAPRNMSDTEYRAWKHRHPKASGTTFGFIDFDATPFKLYGEIIEKLRKQSGVTQ